MDYEPYDSSGTDDDLPPTHQNRIPRGAHPARNGRSVGASYPMTYGEIDMETQIHQLEKEAYSSVLRAFKAQDDAITWEKESLITELRKELGLSNEEHRELLGHVNADDVIQNIRDWRKAGGHLPAVLNIGQAIHDSIPSPTVSVSRKKQKIMASTPLESFGGPSPFHPQPPLQPSLVANPGSVSGSKGKKHKPGQVLLGVSSIKKYPSSGLSGRNQIPNRAPSGIETGELAKEASMVSLVGRKVRTRWPDDNNFYEAVISDYNRADGRYALVYDMGTANETWEWVNLSEISPEDIQWVGEDPGINHGGGRHGSGNGMSRSVGRSSVPGAVRGRGTTKGQSKMDFFPSQNGIGKKTVDDIHILHTDTLVKKVERVFNANHPDALEIEQVKKVLKDHEQALIDAIAKLADLSDGESDEDDHHFANAQPMER
ncbi:protein EMSY-LIKE 3-like isoform X1 [Vigna unguiculata]|uniref:protein EMSY-LIKE 3-like isoform X1 n=1 Tax=Vigna unguiculata TaxID=3917 RepID=UPI001015F0CE|nr:protein EMSY-LIKE 3-like isoform X1 [Vigna unguiculata]